METEEHWRWSDDELTRGSGRINVFRALLVLLRSPFRRGLGTTVRLVRQYVPDWFFDLRYGISTLGHQGVHDLETVGESAGYPYLGSNRRDLRRALRELGTGTGGTFVDLGCGKGRVLVMAALHGYDRLVGVDFVAGFCAAARDNVASFQRRTGNSATIEVLHQDAATYVPGPDTTTFFLFNPFPADVMAAAAKNIHDSWRANPREIRVIYSCALHPEVFEDSGLWRCTGEITAQYPTRAYSPVAGGAPPAAGNGTVPDQR